MSNHKYTYTEKNILHNNLNLIAGHNKLVVQFFKSLDYSKLDKKQIEKYIQILSSSKKTSCWNLMCVRNCNCIIQSEDIVEIISFKNNYLIKKHFLKYLKYVSEYEILCLLPCFVYYLPI